VTESADSLLPPFIFLFLQVVDITIHFNHQPRLVTVEVNNKPLNHLLPPKADSQLIRPKFLPQDLLGGRHLTAEFFGALKFLRSDLLIRDDVFDWHGDILLVCSENGISSNKQTPLP
jgi:hypothetical protein